MKTKYLILFLLLPYFVIAQAPAIKRIDPTFWWVGMKNQNLQLLVYGPQAGTMSYAINYPGVQLVKKHQVENPNYAFLDLTIAPTTKAGTLKITGKTGNHTLTTRYELKARNKEIKAQGINAADFIYLIMPDRFANGDEKNDKFPDMTDTKADRNSPYLRHGGDIQGITNNLNYLQELGITSLWLTPVIENDEPLMEEAPGRMQAGYHGYHFTDHYKIDKRFGGEAAYRQLSAALHKRGMKLIQDAVYNHVSNAHWMYKDQPTKDWFNNWPSYTGTNHKEHPLNDPYGAETDREILLGGWFTPFLPDLNQRNPFLANYLIQHAIWSTENFNLDGWRIDTYKYNDLDFMNRCNQALLTEYPNLHIFGESWVNNVNSQAYFVQNNLNNLPFKSNLPGALDFQMFSAINQGLNEKFGWDEGSNRLYQVLSQDFVYQDPMKLVTFVDNHDTDRYFSMINEDLNKYKIGLTWMLTTRGIPSIYYGTEVLMKNRKDPTDAEVRRDFPGGFKGDKENKFTSGGRNAPENEAYNYVKKLAGYRKSTPALYNGKLRQYIPQNGTYVYFRYDNNKTIMIATNTNDKATDLEMARFAERTKGFTSATNVVTGENISNLATLKIPANTALVLELQK